MVYNKYMEREINKLFQINFAELEIKAVAHYLRGLKMIKLSTGVEISEDTVISALKKAGISVEPKPAPKKVRLYEEGCEGDDIFLKVVNDICRGVDVSIVDSNGVHKLWLLKIKPDGILRYSTGKDTGFEVDKNLQIKLL
jgi:hypothetical protein